MKTIKGFFTKERLILILNIFFVFSILFELHIFYNSISTLIRIIVISILFGIFFIFYASKKERKYLIAYFLALTIYIILHLIHCANISSIINYSAFSEILYFIKMIMNVFIIFIIVKLDYKLSNYKKIVQLSTILIAGSIIVCNIFEIGYTSYNFEGLRYSIFDWFSDSRIPFAELSTKGLFHLTNQIAAILALYFSLLLIYLKEKIDSINVLSLVVCSIAMMMLGTRVSSYMPLILITISFISYVLLVIVKREKFVLKFIIVLIMLFAASFSLLQYAPIQLRNEYYKILFAKPEEPSESDIELMATPLNELSNKEFRELLKLYNIDEDFYNDYYKLENDREFYEYYVSLETTKKNDTRFLEKEVIKRIVSLNDNKNDKYLGIGYDRVMNVFNIESDYVMQYYAIGLIGTILLLGVNVIILIWSYFKILFNLHKYFNFKNIMLIVSVTMFLATAYLSGNLLNSISCIIPISLVVGILINELKNNDENDYESIVGMRTCLYDEKTIINNIFNSKKQNIIFNVNPLIVMNMRKNVDSLKVINKELYNIPDGNGIVLASKLKSGNIKKSIPGIGLMNKIVEKSVENKYKIYLYGAKEESVSGTKKELKRKYKSINIIGYSNGYVSEDEALDDIIKTKPDVLFIATGSPKQEDFIINNYNKLSTIKIIMPVGGSFDVISGSIKRAPKWIRNIKMEWLYRMIKEPKRFKYLGSMVKFIFLVIFSDICYNNNEVENDK